MRNLYETLEVSKTASDDEIKKSYKKLALRYHPDKCKEPNAEEKFKEISFAYQILSDADKRKKYDVSGEDSFNTSAGGSGGMNPEDFFNHIFGGTPFGFKFSGGGEQPRQKPAPKIYELQVSLKDLFLRKKFTKEVSLAKICKMCDGVGCQDKSSVKKCGDCNGKGIKIIIRQMGPMIQQIQSKCDKCSGRGTWIEDENKCKVCKGNKVIECIENHEIDLTHNQIYKILLQTEKSISFKNCGDEYPDQERGDLTFKISHTQTISDESENVKFTLKDRIHLHASITISLLSALTGAKISFRKLNGEMFNIEINNIIEPNKVLTIEGEGMINPDSGNPHSTRGNLYIAINIEFPKRINLDYKPTLEKIFN